MPFTAYNKTKNYMMTYIPLIHEREQQLLVETIIIVGDHASKDSLAWTSDDQPRKNLWIIQ